MSFEDDFEANESSLETLLKQFEPIKTTGVEAPIKEARKWFDKYILKKKYQTEYLSALAFQYLSFGDFDRLATSVRLNEESDNEEFVKNLYFKPINVPLNNLTKSELETMINNFEEVKKAIDDFSLANQLMYSLLKESKKYIAWKGCLEGCEEVCYYIERKEDLLTGDVAHVYI